MTRMALFWQNLLETVCFGQNDFILANAAQKGGFGQNSLILGKADQTCVY